EAALQILLDDALVGLEIEDGRAVDQRVTEEDRLGVGGRRLAPVVQEPVRPFGQHHLGGRGADARRLRQGEDRRRAQHAAPEALLFGEQGRTARRRPFCGPHVLPPARSCAVRPLVPSSLYMAMPPLTSSTWPVTKLAEGEAR